MNLNEIAKEAWESAEDNGWHAAKEDENGDLRFTSTFERLGLIHSEVSEAYEAFRKFGSMKWHGDGDKPEGLESELADIIIRVCELGYYWDQYDLDKAVREKMDYNKKRLDVPIRNGGKVI